MAGKIDWESQIGRRIKLRDLHVFVAIVQRGSMAKAAVHLGVSQSAVSDVIADLEHAVGVRLLDRGPQGVEPTSYGRALLTRSLAAFDELKQGIRDIEFLADPAAGELRIGCVESLASAILLPTIERFSRQFPRAVLHVDRLTTPSLDLPTLRDRSLDLVLARIMQPVANDDDLNVEILFDDHLVVVAGTANRWTRRHKIDLVELINEPWTLTPPGSRPYVILKEAFQARGLAMPKIHLTTFSIPLRVDLVANGPYITTLPNSVLRFNAKQFSLKALPIDLPVRPWPLAVVTMKRRTVSPVAQRFIEHARDFIRTLVGGALQKKKSAWPTVGTLSDHVR